MASNVCQENGPGEQDDQDAPPTGECRVPKQMVGDGSRHPGRAVREDAKGGRSRQRKHADINVVSGALTEVKERGSTPGWKEVCHLLTS